MARAEEAKQRQVCWLTIPEYLQVRANQLEYGHRKRFVSTLTSTGRRYRPKTFNEKKKQDAPIALSGPLRSGNM